MKKLFAALLAFSLIATGCQGGKQEGGSVQESEVQESDVQESGATESKVDKIKADGKITMYTNAEFPPYEFMEDGQIMGVDVEIGKAIAEKLGVELDIVNAEFGGIVAGIASGKGDMAITGLTINEERKATVDFSVPYVDSVQYIILPEDSDIEVVEHLEGKIAGVQTGTTGAMLIEDEISGGVLADKDADLKHYNSAPIAMQDLIAGRISAVIIDELVAISIAKENSGYKAIPFVYESGAPVTEQFGVAIAKGNEDLLAIINEVVESMVSEGLIEKYIEDFS